MVELVCLVILESPVALVLKVFPENLTDIQEALDPKASPETQASQVVEGWMEVGEMTGSQEPQGTPQ